MPVYFHSSKLPLKSSSTMNSLGVPTNKDFLFLVEGLLESEEFIIILKLLTRPHGKY